jgi:hypothetical protein
MLQDAFLLSLSYRSSPDVTELRFSAAKSDMRIWGTLYYRFHAVQLLLLACFAVIRSYFTADTSRRPVVYQLDAACNLCSVGANLHA